MSRQWSDRLEILLRTDSIRVRRYRGWHSRKPPTEIARPFSFAAGEATVGADVLHPDANDPIGSVDWRREIGAALDAVGDGPSLRGVPVRIEVDDAYVHFDVITGSFAAQSDSQLDRVAVACFADWLGPDRGDLEVRWQLQADGQHLLLCAMSRRLVTAVREELAARRLALEEVAPVFTRRWNSRREEFARGVSLFASASRSHGLIALVREGVVVGLSSMSGPAASAAAGPRAVEGVEAAMKRLDLQADRLAASFGVVNVDRRVVIDAGSLPELHARWAVLRRRRITYRGLEGSDQRGVGLSRRSAVLDRVTQRMPPLQFDFSGRRRRPPAAGLALLGLGLLAAGAAGLQLGDVRERVLAARQESAMRQAAETRRAAPKSVDPRLAAQLKSSLQVARSLDSPWAALLDALESSRPERVTLLSVEPSGLKRSVVVTAEARDAAAMLAHLRALQDDARLRHITLVGHQREVQVAGAPLRYRLQGEW